MRAFFVAAFGTMTSAEPSLGVLASSTYGYVWPPSTDSEIFTFAVEIGGALVPATFQVTVCVEPAAHEVGADVTRNGPVPAASVSVVSGLAAFVPPLLSRAVKRKSSRGGLAFVPANPT